MSNKRNTKAAFIVLAVVIVLVAALLLVWQLVRPQTEIGSKTVYISITHMNGKEVRHTFRTNREYLGELLTDEELIDGYESAYGYTVTTVDGEFADDTAGQWWVFTKGGEWVTTDVSTTPIYDGDTYEFSVYVS